MTATVPFSDLASTTEEIRADVRGEWERLLDSNRWIGGPEIARFEEEWARYCGTTEAVAVGNGTDALHLILRALGIGPGDEVLVPANTFVATAEAVVLAGAHPRFVDVDPTTLGVTPETVKAAVTPSTAAVLAVHLYGHVVDLAGLAQVTRERGLALVEDAAQAHGATRDGIRAGSAGIAASFSFYPGKNLGAFGDGGAVTTDDTGLAAIIRSLANHGRLHNSHYEHPYVGTNSRLDTLQAVVLRAKLRRLDKWTDARRRIVAAYLERLVGLPLHLVEPADGVQSAWHLLVARVAERDRVQQDLALLGVQTGIHYPIPCPEQVAFARWSDGPLPVSSATAGQILSLPLHPHMSVDEVDIVCGALAKVLAAEEPGDVSA